MICRHQFCNKAATYRLTVVIEDVSILTSMCSHHTLCWLTDLRNKAKITRERVVLAEIPRHSHVA